MQYLFSSIKSVIVLLLLSALSGLISSLVFYIVLVLFVVMMGLYGKKFKEMSRHRIDCYFGLISSVIFIYFSQFRFIDTELMDLAQFFAFIWILISITRLIENNRKSIQNE